jgi:hypothetical protein
MKAQEAQMTARYAPMRVTETPEMIDVTEAVKENGIILESALSRGDAAKASGIALT